MILRGKPARLLLLVFSILASFYSLLIVGCWNHTNEFISTQEKEGASSPHVHLTVPELKINFLVPDGTKTSASILKNEESLGSPSVIFKLTLANIGKLSQPVIEIRKIVPVSEDGTADVTFSNLPALPLIISIEMTNCSKSGYRKYRGGIDLIANRVNVVDVAPENSRLEQDIIAELMTMLVSRDDTFGLIGANLAYRSSKAIAGLDFVDNSAYETAINNFKNYSQIADSSVTDVDESTLVVDENTGTTIVGNEVLVTFKSVPTLQDIQLAQAQIGGVLAGSFPEIRTCRFVITDSLPFNTIVNTVKSLQTQASYNNFNYNVGVHSILQTTSLPDDPDYPKNWGLEKIGAYESWGMLPSQGVGVAVLDTGVLRNHEDLQANIDFTNSINFTSEDSSNFEDAQSHGTHVAGIIASTINNARGSVGVAPNARIVAVKVMGDNGMGSDLNISLGIKYAADISFVRVINMSLGHQGTISRAMAAAIDYAVSCDKLVVVAAGNNNDDATFFAPASYEKCFTVAATSPNDSRAWFSNYGMPVDISAPGEDIYAPVIGGSSLYGYKSGTSMAAPFVSGLAAAIFSLRPEMTADNVRQLIIRSADTVASDSPIGPRINMKKTIENIPNTPIQPPTLALSGLESAVGGATYDYEAIATDKEDTSLTFAWTVTGGYFVLKETQNLRSKIAWVAPPNSNWYTISCRVRNSNGAETIAIKEVYVVAEKPSFSIVYDGNGNTGGFAPVDSNKYEKDVTVTVLGNTGNLTRSGYVFNGWNTKADGSGTNYTSGSTFLMGLANTVLYAKWSLQTYSVTYNGNGNTGGFAPVDSNKYEKDVTVTVLENTGNLAKTGYIFSAWNTEADGSGADYGNGSKFSMGSSDLVLYAKWVLIPPFTVTYMGNGNTGGFAPVDSNKYQQDAKITVLGNTGNLTKTGYIFDGWNTKADGTGTNYSTGSIYQQSNPAGIYSYYVTLYAKWSIPRYSITYSGNGSSDGLVPVDSNKYYQGAIVTVLGNTGNLTKAGYTFGGWNTKADGTGINYSVGGGFSMSSADIILYAKWSLNQPPRFTKYESGIINDSTTSLQWYVASTSANDRATIYGARLWANQLSVDGGGWSLATLEQLKTLYPEAWSTGWFPSESWASDVKYVSGHATVACYYIVGDKESWWLEGNNVFTYALAVRLK